MYLDIESKYPISHDWPNRTYRWVQQWFQGQGHQYVCERPPEFVDEHGQRYTASYACYGGCRESLLQQQQFLRRAKKHWLPPGQLLRKRVSGSLEGIQGDLGLFLVGMECIELSWKLEIKLLILYILEKNGGFQLSLTSQDFRRYFFELCVAHSSCDSPFRCMIAIFGFSVRFHEPCQSTRAHLNLKMYWVRITRSIFLS